MISKDRPAWTEIVLEGEERDRLLRALAQASFESAPHDLEHIQDWSNSDRLNSQQLSQLLNPKPSPLAAVLSMAIVAGRRCHTFVYLDGDNLLLFRAPFLEHRPAEMLDMMLQRTQDLYLCSLHLVDEPADFFRNPMLDHRLACYNVHRGDNENNWALRRRTLYELGPRWLSGACEFLFGAFRSDWSRSEEEMIQFMALEARRIGPRPEKWRAMFDGVLERLKDDPLPKRICARQTAKN